MKLSKLFLCVAAVLALTMSISSHAAVKPLRVLLITGGCCHDYTKQKDILKKGLEARAHVKVTHAHSPDKSTSPPLPILGNPDYGKGYDVIIHDECAAKQADKKIVQGVLTPHKNGIPGVNLHCAMHSYRVGDHRAPTKPGSEDSMWFDYLGLQSSGHGPKAAMEITFTAQDHPITAGMKPWTTGPEELYNNVQVLPGTKALASAVQMQKPRVKRNKKGKAKTPAAAAKAKRAEAVVVWVNEYKGTRVFSTSVGHYNETVEDGRYLDLVTRGLLWSCKKLNQG